MLIDMVGAIKASKRNQPGGPRWLAAAIFPVSLACSLALFNWSSAYAQVPDGSLTDDLETYYGDPFEDQLEEDLEQDVEEDVTDAAEDNLEDVIEDQVEDQVEQDVADQVDDGLEENVESDIEEAIEDQIEDNIDENLEVTLEKTIEEDVEAQLEEDVERGVEQVVEASVEEQVEQAVEDRVESHTIEMANGRIQEIVEALVAQGAEAEVEDSVESAVEEKVEATVAETIEETVEDSVAATVEASVEESVESGVEESVAVRVEEGVENTIEESVEEVVQASVESNIESAVEEEVAGAVEGSVAEAVEDRIENRVDRILEDIESGFDVDERYIEKDQWLVMAEPEVFEELAEQGYLFDTVTELPGLGLRLAEVAAPSSFDINEVRRGVLDVVGKDRAEVDLNHIYTAGIPRDFESPEGITPRSALHFPEDTDQLPLRIGMIDSRVDTDHPALDQHRIQTRSFASDEAELPAFHGTAVASIIAADDGEYRGLAPRSELYAAAVFQNDAERGEIASTVSLVRALDWLMSAGVDAVNISLAGPPNRLLEAALQRAAKANMLLLAAAGNGGPVAQPMFPAAYDSVVAVTAVDANGHVFRLANRGDYLDIAAPGVGLLHARAGGGYTTSSGTSFAVPFAVTAAARLRQLQPDTDVLQTLYSLAEDVGPPGRDEIYGRGLLRP